jgi:putative membrane protein
MDPMGLQYLAPAALMGMLVAIVPAGGAAAQSASQATGAGTDSMFVHMAASGGMAEVRLGQMAQQKGASAEVKRFGQQMVTDHTAANKQLMSAAQSSGMTPPTTLLPKHQQVVDRLSKLSGSQFDSTYMTMMVMDHAEETQLFRQQSESGQAEALRQVAAQTLPKLQQHLNMAKQVAVTVGADTTAVPASTGHAEHQGATGQ